MVTARDMGRGASARRRANELIERAESAEGDDAKRELMELANAWLEFARQWEKNFLDK
jgi:hypothetical protein